MKRNLQIAIAGRKNVGKSTLFNAIAGQKKAIVADIAGVTRDNISFDLNGLTFLDTPGIDILFSKKNISVPKRLYGEVEIEKEISKRTEELFAKVDSIIFMVAYPDIYPFELDLSIFLRKQNKPVLLVVNKVDSLSFLESMGDYYQLGFSDLIPISAKSKWNLTLLKDKLKDLIKENFNYIWQPEIRKANSKKNSQLSGLETTITIVGRPNSGKSTLLNKITGQDLALVSSVPGTTRDSIDTEIMYHGQLLKIIDTAGIRKQGKRNNKILERFSFFRTEGAIKKSHAVLHLIDAAMGVTDTDKKIFDITVKQGKQVLICLNKWDLIQGTEKNLDRFWKNQCRHFPILAEMSVISISALEGLRVGKIFKIILKIIEDGGRYFPTSRLNSSLSMLLGNKHIVSAGGRFKIYYITQVGVHPPTFVFFVNNPDLIKKNAFKYIERQLKISLNLKNVLIRIKFKGRHH